MSTTTTTIITCKATKNGGGACRQKEKNLDTYGYCTFHRSAKFGHPNPPSSSSSSLVISNISATKIDELEEKMARMEERFATMEEIMKKSFVVMEYEEKPKSKSKSKSRSKRDLGVPEASEVSD